MLLMSCRAAAAAGLLAAVACTSVPAPNVADVAERYVTLVLKVGQHDADYVDAYYGDPTWRPAGDPTPLADLAAEAAALRNEVAALPPPEGLESTLVALRYTYLERQLSSVASRIEMLSGTRFTFDEEAQRLYDASPPHKSEGEFQALLDAIDTLVPGRGPLLERYTAYRNRFVIPPDKIDVVFRAAIVGCRARTLAHLRLPEQETFSVEYVTGKSWSAYNWYKGNYASVIQVNTDLPITIDRAVDLACHEGYPGHHVYNLLLEDQLVRGRRWVEFSVYPLFSPQSLIAEGTANFGIDVAFPGDERVAFERESLYPMAGLDPAEAERYARVQEAVEKLSYAGNEAARRYLDGEIDRSAAQAYLERYALMTADRAAQRVRFMDQYRSYVINYNLGQDLVREYVEGQGGTSADPAARWRIFGALLASPRLPSGLK